MTSLERRNGFLLICGPRRLSATRAVATFLAALLLVTTISGCSARAERENEANARAARLGHPDLRYSEEISPETAFFLGFLPFGIGGLYVHKTSLAASGLLWPFSMLWMPKMAYDSAVDINQSNFKHRIMNALETPSTPE
jgi:hypothetical protein